MIQAQAHINQLPNGDFELTACSYLSTTGANVDLMRGASRIKPVSYTHLTLPTILLV